MSKRTFAPEASQACHDTVATFLRKPYHEMAYDMEKVPGIGPKTSIRLDEAGVDNIYKLFGHALLLKEEHQTPEQLGQKLYDQLKEWEINAHRATIVQMVLEKLSVSFPHFFDQELEPISEVSEEEEEEDGDEQKGQELIEKSAPKSAITDNGADADAGIFGEPVVIPGVLYFFLRWLFLAFLMLELYRHADTSILSLDGLPAPLRWIKYPLLK